MEEVKGDLVLTLCSLFSFVYVYVFLFNFSKSILMFGQQIVTRVNEIYLFTQMFKKN